MKTLKTLVNRKFSKIDLGVFLSVSNPTVADAMKLVGIKDSILAVVNSQKETDFITFYIDDDGIDISIFFIIYLGSKGDNGFLSVFLENIIENKTKIITPLVSILERSSNFDINRISVSLEEELASYMRDKNLSRFTIVGKYLSLMVISNS